MTAVERVTMPRPPFNYEFRRDAEAVAVVASGSRLVIETEDAFGHQIARPGDRRDRVALPYGNPLTGPIRLLGASPGDALSIEIESIDPIGDSAATYALPDRRTAALLGPEATVEDSPYPVDPHGVRWEGGLRLPYAPMIGTIGTTPAIGVPTTDGCGGYGGNMDLTIIEPGATVLLPVLAEGALLYIGDCHAAQGAGEWSGAALEMRAAITCVLGVVSGAAPPAPRVLTAERIWAVGTARHLEDAIAQAYSYLALWLEAEYLLPRWKAYTLLTQVGELSIGYYTAGVAAAGIRREYIPRSEAVSAP